MERCGVDLWRSTSRGTTFDQISGRVIQLYILSKCDLRTGTELYKCRHRGHKLYCLVCMAVILYLSLQSRVTEGM
jgi:hypothetical protein